MVLDSTANAPQKKEEDKAMIDPKVLKGLQKIKRLLLTGKGTDSQFEG